MSHDRPSGHLRTCRTADVIPVMSNQTWLIRCGHIQRLARKPCPHTHTTFFTARCYAQRKLCCHKVSVRPSVTGGFVSKRLNLWSKFFYHVITHHSSFLRQNRVPKLRRGGEYSWGIKKIRDLRPRTRYMQGC